MRRGKKLTRWDASSKEEDSSSSILEGIMLLRKDGPFETDRDSGVCYVISGMPSDKMPSNHLEIFGNPHASTLTRLR